MMELTEDVIKGQQVYNKFTLTIYDFLLFKLLTKPVWKCPTETLLALYNKHVTDNHLDVGVGSGYLLDHCNFPSSTPRLALMDLNKQCLTFTQRRLLRYSPCVYQHNVFDVIDINEPNFDSISMNYLLHCLPGTIADKMVVFDHLYSLLNPGGVIFGHTIITDSSEKKVGWQIK